LSLKKNFLVIPALALGIVTLAHAQAPAAAAAPAAVPTRVAILNVQQAVLNTADGKKATADLTAKFTPRRSVLEKKTADIQTMQEQARKGGATMSEDAKAKIARDIESAQKSLQRDSEDFDADVQQEENKIMGDVGEKLMNIVAKYAQQNGIALVLNVSDPNTPVLWIDQSIEITQDIVRLYDQAHPPQTGAAPATAKPPAGGAAPPPASAKPPAAPNRPAPPPPAGKKQ